MGRDKKPKGLKIGGLFTPLLNEVQDSHAYKELNGTAAKLYLRLYRVARTVAHNLGSNSEYNIQFNFTYSEAKRYGFSESTTRRALHELWEKGFISVIQIGGRTASNACGRMSSKYQLCDKWKSYGHQWKDRRKYESDPWEFKSEPEKNAANRC